MPTALPTVKKKFSWIWCEQSELKINPRKKKSWSFTLLIKMCVRFFYESDCKDSIKRVIFDTFSGMSETIYSPEKRRFETVIGKWLQRKFGYFLSVSSQLKTKTQINSKIYPNHSLFFRNLLQVVFSTVSWIEFFIPSFN